MTIILSDFISLVIVSKFEVKLRKMVTLTVS